MPSILEPERRVETRSSPDYLVEGKVLHIIANPSSTKTDGDIRLSESLDPEKKEKVIEEIRKNNTVFDTDGACGPG